MEHKHLAVNRLDIIHGPTVERLPDRLNSRHAPPPAPPQDWIPKNPEINWPTMTHERPLTREEWTKTGFPNHPLPKEVEGVVNTNVWEERIEELCSASNVNWGLVKIMEELHTQLVNGASSQVEPPGTELTKTDNWFSDPPPDNNQKL